MKGTWDISAILHLEGAVCKKFRKFKNEKCQQEMQK